jgi:hypothetical protein
VEPATRVAGVSVETRPFSWSHAGPRSDGDRNVERIGCVRAPGHPGRHLGPLAQRPPEPFRESPPEPAPTPKAQHIATLRAETKRLSEELAKVNRELAALGVYDG